MNSNHRVPRLVLSGTIILLLLSIADKVFGFNAEFFSRINLISDITGHASETPDSSDKTIPPNIESAKGYDFTLFTNAKLITNFSADTSASSLQNFSGKLSSLVSGKKQKIRIAYFGDSMIEGDLLTQTLRKLLQEKFGGHGVGFVPITSPVSKFRTTVSADYSDTWTDDNFKTSNAKYLFFSGHSFHSSGAWVAMTDRTINDDSPIEKSLLCGPLKSETSILVNGYSKKIKPSALFNRIALANDNSRSIKLQVMNDQLRVYGISFESEQGIFVDNFSFRGITGIELNVMDSAFLNSISSNNPYDLVVLQYGVNMLFRPNEKNFSWYKKNMMPVVKKLKTAFPNSDIVLVSTADRAFRYGSEYKSALGIDSLIQAQAEIAFENKISFYNQFATMGGKNSIVDWAVKKPSLANKDYIHPNHRGAEMLAGYFYEAIINDLNEYSKKLK